MHHPDVEQRLLAACFLHPPLVQRVAVELADEDFLHPGHRAIYRSMREAVEAGSQFDQATVRARVAAAGGMEQHEADRLVLDVAAADAIITAWREYVQVLREESEWHRAAKAGRWLVAAAQDRDAEARDSALDLLARRGGEGWDESMDSLWEDVRDRLEGKRGLGLALPFPTLTAALGGGLTPGEVTVIGGWTSHAKSVLAMQIADKLAGQQMQVAYLTNEMRRDEVALRLMAGYGGPGFATLTPGNLSAGQASRAVKAMAQVDRLPLKIIGCAGRACEAVCAWIAQRKPDLAVLDLFNRLPRKTGKVAELDEMVNRLCDVAARSGAHVVLVSQLNRNRIPPSGEPPHPALGDLRDTGTLATHPANVIFTYLAKTEDLFSRPGFVEIAKARNGRVGASVDVLLDPMKMRLVQSV